MFEHSLYWWKLNKFQFILIFIFTVIIIIGSLTSLLQDQDFSYPSPFIFCYLLLICQTSHRISWRTCPSHFVSCAGFVFRPLVASFECYVISLVCVHLENMHLEFSVFRCMKSFPSCKILNEIVMTVMKKWWKTSLVTQVGMGWLLSYILVICITILAARCQWKIIIRSLGL